MKPERGVSRQRSTAVGVHSRHRNRNEPTRKQRTTLARGGGGEGRRVQPRGVGLNAPGTSPGTGNTTPEGAGYRKSKFERVRSYDALHQTRCDPPIARAYPCTVTAQSSAETATKRIAAFFDLDKTIIAKSSTFAFSKPFFDQGLLNRRAVLKSSYAHFLFLLSGADHDQMERMRAHLVKMSTGWDVAQVKSIVAETLHDVVDPLIFAEAADLIADHKIRGHDIVVVSASGEEVVGPIAEALGADFTAATQLAVEDGKYTGEVEFYCYGEGKVQAIEQLAEQENYDLARCFAYSDSLTDLPMLQAVGHPTAVNPDRGLRKEAASRGWPILTFSNPVSLRARFQAPSSTTVAATAAVGLSALAAGAITYGLLRRRR